MKIGILTQPLRMNYGGILQNYALQTVLKRMRHEVITIDREKIEMSVSRKVLSLGKHFLLYLMGKSPKIRLWQTAKEQRLISEHITRFVRDNITATEKIYTTGQLQKTHDKYNFDAYIVGSDQVWRPKYSPSITNYFLDFLKDNDSVKKIAYAASFGVENWEFSEEETTQCAELVKQFEKISVREHSGLALCEKYLNVTAQHVLDPTLLLDKDDYIELIRKENIPDKKNSLMLYILDQTPEKYEIVSKFNKHLGLEVNQVMPKRKFPEATKKNFEECVYPSIQTWIKGFEDSQYVITDSFHGCVFSIIFNKPFAVIGNQKRGLARFDSLLSLFNLTDRFISVGDDFNVEALLTPIDYTSVNKILLAEKDKALNFLLSSLNS